jgi:hypothetical protein
MASPTLLRPYERGIAEACERHLRNLTPFFIQVTNSGSYLLDWKNAASAFTVYRSLPYDEDYQAETINAVDQPMRSFPDETESRLDGRHRQAWLSSLIRQSMGSTIFQHD